MHALLIAVGLVANSADSVGSAKTPPNVVMIISDDQAFTDFGFMGHPVIQTPHIDRLAEQSALFPHGYVPSSLCRPSLVTMLTGLYPHQHQVHFNDPPDKGNRQEAERFIGELPTLPRWLGELGYVSLQTGKFWEGHYSNAGFTDGMTHGDPQRGGRHGDEGLKIGRRGMQPIFDFIDAADENPFFLWYAPFLPHTPFNPPEKYRKLYADADVHPRIRLYYAMCTWFDDTVGELLDYLDENGLSENTLVVFVVDNGWITNTEEGPSYAPKSKRSPFEMGIRTPIMFRQPGKIPPAVHNDLVNSVDLAPTILAATGREQEGAKLPGANLAPICLGEAKLQRKAVFGDIYEHDASELGAPANDLLYRWVRSGPWKLIDAADPDEDDMLFHLDDDPEELTNLADCSEHAETLQMLRGLLDEWWTPGVVK